MIRSKAGRSSTGTKTGRKNGKQKPLKSNNDECQLLNLGRATGTSTGWGPMGVGAALLKSKLYISQQYAVVAKVAKTVLGCVNRMAAGSLREMIVFIY